MERHSLKDQREKLGRAWARLKAAHHCALESLDASPQQCERAYDLLMNALDDYDQAFEGCWHLTPPAAPAPEPVPEPVPAEPKPQVIGTIEWGRWKPAEFQARCTCYRFWMSTLPPPTCPVHGQALPPQIWTSTFRPDNKK